MPETCAGCWPTHATTTSCSTPCGFWGFPSTTDSCHRLEPSWPRPSPPASNRSDRPRRTGKWLHRLHN
ncbi:hypothetical protein BC828DRAFT_379767 [Blastocladiella britannica]|nr:hypothetical protein BC828DRAFT_379767 [Blastocladiella britannica]